MKPSELPVPVRIEYHRLLENSINTMRAYNAAVPVYSEAVDYFGAAVGVFSVDYSDIVEALAECAKDESDAAHRHVDECRAAMEQAEEELTSFRFLWEITQ